jgi:Domain of unknown function (DUF6894)
MPRYFFHLLDENTNNLARDSVGYTLSDAGQASREAVALARDIATHGLQGRRWQIIVTNGDAVILTVSHTDIQPRRMKPWLDLARRIAAYEPRLRPRIFAWLLTALVFAVLAQAAVTTTLLRPG